MQTFRTRKKSVQKLGRHNSGLRHPYLFFGGFLVAAMVLLVIGFLQFGGQTVGASSARIVQIYIDGKQQTVPTRAITVADLLERLDININDKDIVEPKLSSAITEDGFSINIYRARTVMVVDGMLTRVIETAQPTPRAIAKAAGLEVHPEDIINNAPVDQNNPTTAIKKWLVAKKIVLDRATPINLNVYGNNIPVRSHANTVGELLAEKNVTLKKGDTLEPAASTPLAKAARIFIVRKGKKVESKEEVIPAPVETINDPTLTAGARRIEEEGAPGRKVVTYEIELRNGQEVARRVLQEVIATPPIKQVVVIGTQPIPGGNGALLHQLRMCETGGNYQTNTGNGYYGAYQFSKPTWDSMGTGVAFPHQAPPPIQDDAALRLARRSGFHSQFPGCSAKLSLPSYPY